MKRLCPLILNGLKLAAISCNLTVRLHGGVPSGFEATAQQRGYCRSLIWESATTQTPQGTRTSYFTSYVNGSGTPLFETQGTRIIVSQELRKIGVGSEYRNDFLLYLQGTLMGFGSTVSQFPTLDSDLNGVPDVAQIDRPIDSTLSGNTIWRSPQTLTEPFVGRISRAVNSTTGTYTARFLTGPQLEYSGTYRVIASRGDAIYRRGPTNTMRLSIRVDGAYRSPQLEGPARYTVSDRNTLMIQPIVLTGTDGYQYRIKQFILKRVGDRYSGDVELEDGEPLTSWRDFVSWHFTITDTNDSDANGIPDISDDILWPPTVQNGPIDMAVTEGASLSLSVTASGNAPLAYQWQRNTANIPGATSAEYRKDMATQSDNGIYRVIVSNRAGWIETNPARVTVVPTNDVPIPIAGPFIRPSTGISYYLLSSSTWPAALTASRKLGGYLATIPDQDTRDWIVRNVALHDGVARAVWIGLSDVKAEGVFDWDSGSLATFRDWKRGEPNNCCGGEPYVGFHAAAKPEGWNDYAADFRLSGIAEVYPQDLRIKNAVELSFPAIVGRRYQLISTEATQPFDWRNDGESITASRDLVELFRTGTSTGRLYRLIKLD
jgi:hypothetical protein